MNSNNLEKQKEKVLIFFKEEKFEDVIVAGEKLLKQTQNDTQLIFILGLASINIQNFSNAENYFRRLVSFKRNAENLYTLANIQKKLKKFNQAIISYEEAIKLSKRDTRRYVKRQFTWFAHNYIPYKIINV